MLIDNIPIEIFNLILLDTIHPYNNFHYLLLLVFRDKKIRNTILEINRNRMYCSICKTYIYKNGTYCSLNNKPICCLHMLYCNDCNSEVDIYQYSMLFSQCILCKEKLSI